MRVMYDCMCACARLSVRVCACVRVCVNVCMCVCDFGCAHACVRMCVYVIVRVRALKYWLMPYVIFQSRSNTCFYRAGKTIVWLLFYDPK